MPLYSVQMQRLTVESSLLAALSVQSVTERKKKKGKCDFFFFYTKIIDV